MGSNPRWGFFPPEQVHFSNCIVVSASVKGGIELNDFNNVLQL